MSNKLKEKHLCCSLLLNKVAGIMTATLLKKTWTQVFSYEFCEIVKNTFFQRTVRPSSDEVIFPYMCLYFLFYFYFEYEILLRESNFSRQRSKILTDSPCVTILFILCFYGRMSGSKTCRKYAFLLVQITYRIIIVLIKTVLRSQSNIVLSQGIFATVITSEKTLTIFGKIASL